MSTEKALSKIYKPVNPIHTVTYTEDVSTIMIDIVNKTTSTPNEFLKEPITIPIIYLSPTTASNDKFDTWLVITLTLIAICLLLIVLGILYCYSRTSILLTQMEHKILLKTKTLFNRLIFLKMMSRLKLM